MSNWGNSYCLGKDKLADLYLANSEPDFEVHVKDQVIKVHKLLLLHSKILTTMIQDCKDNHNQLTLDADPKLFQILVDILSYKMTKDQLTSALNLDEFIEFTNMVHYYDIPELSDILSQRFGTYKLTSENLYSVYKKVKCKIIKQICKHKIFMFITDDKLRTELFKHLDYSDDVISFLQEAIKIRQPGWNEQLSYKIVKDCLAVYKGDSKVKDNFLSMIDISKFSLSELIINGKELHAYYGEKFTMLMLDKLNSNIQTKKDPADKELKSITLNYVGTGYDTYQTFPQTLYGGNWLVLKDS